MKTHQALSDYERDKMLIPPLDDPEMAAVRALNLSPASLLRHAGELEQEGRLQEALALLNRAVAMDTKLVSAYVDLISVCGRLGLNQQAEHAYDQAIALDPNRAEAYYNFGVFCFERRRLGEAQASFERAVQLSPRHAEALHNWGVILGGNGNGSGPRLSIAAPWMPNRPIRWRIFILAASTRIRTDMRSPSRNLRNLWNPPVRLLLHICMRWPR